MTNGAEESLNPRKRARPSSGRQSKLGEYGNVAPVVNRLRSLSPRKTDHRSPNNTNEAPRSFRPRSDYDDGLNGQSREYRNVEAIVKSRRHGPNFLDESPQEVTNNKHAFSGDEKGHDTPTRMSSDAAVRDDDGFKRKKQAHPASPLPSDTLESQRRRPLNQSDWLGLDQSKPLHMSFASDRGKEQVAKRRKLDDRDRLRKEVTHLARHRVPSVQEQYMMRGALQPNPLLQDDSSIRIRIGDAALVSQTDATSRVRDGTVMAKSVSSDSMLLDEEVDGPRSLPRFDRDSRASLQAESSSRGTDGHTFKDQSIEHAAVHEESNKHQKGRDHTSSGHFMEVSPHRAPEQFYALKHDSIGLTRTPHGKAPTDHDIQIAHSWSANLGGAASTQEAVKGSMVSGTPQHNRSPLRQEEVDNTRTGADKVWRNFMDVYTEADAASTTSTALTSLRRGGKAFSGNAMQTQRKHQAAPGVWDVPDTPPKTFTISTHNKPKLDTTNKVAATKTASDHTLPIRARAQPDPDAAWKAFVFGDDDASIPSTASNALNNNLDQPSANHCAAMEHPDSRGPSQPATKAATFGSSSFLTSSSGVGPPSIRISRTDEKNTSSPTKSSFPYDRPSSIANASTTATVLHARSTEHRIRHGTFVAPKKHDALRGRSGEEEDEVEDIEDSD